MTQAITYSITGPFNFTLHLVQGGEMKLGDMQPGGMALDGCVRGASLDDPDGRVSLDHHDGCLRLITAATCEQVRRYILFGGKLPEDVYVNDIDGDVLMSLWLLANPEAANETEVRMLTRAVGAVDAHGPAGRLELSPGEREYAEIFFSPEGIFDFTPRDVQDPELFDVWPDLIRGGVERIGDIIDGNVDLSEETFDAEILELTSSDLPNGVKAIMVGATGFGAFEGLYDEGYGLVIIAGPLNEATETRTYTIGKRSDLVPFDIGAALARLSGVEPGWGGGSSIAGSPRPGGSALSWGAVWATVTSPSDVMDRDADSIYRVAMARSAEIKAGKGRP